MSTIDQEIQSLPRDLGPLEKARVVVEFAPRLNGVSVLGRQSALVELLADALGIDERVIRYQMDFARRVPR